MMFYTPSNGKTWREVIQGDIYAQSYCLAKPRQCVCVHVCVCERAFG